jgi:ParB/RepB/Spo0J family partition protein
MAVKTDGPARSVALESIDVPENVRELDPAHVEALAGSIALQGLLVPLVVRPAGDRFELVAGFHRAAAARRLGMTEVSVVVRDADSEDADRAVENIARKQLNAYEEARAVKAMLDQGLTEEGAAQALGWPRQRVTQRAKLLALPDDVARAFGAGWLAMSSLDFTLGFHQGFPGHCALLARYLIHAAKETDRVNRVDGHDLAWQFRNAQQWAHETGVEGSELFMVNVGSFGLRDYIEAAGGVAKTKKHVREAIDEIGSIEGHRGYGQQTPGTWARVEFAEDHVDQARALGVLLETDRGAYITDRAVLKQLMEDAAKAYLPVLRQLKAQEKATHAEAKKAEKRAKADAPTNPLDAIEAQHKAKQREFAVQGRAANLALGDALLQRAAVVDPADLDVAKLFVYGLLGPRTRFSGHKIEQGYELKKAGMIAAAGLRLCIEELSSVEVPKLRSGKAGKPRVTYAELADSERWMWKFVDGAATAGELYGRALCVLWAAHYAIEDVVPFAQRYSSVSAGLFSYDDKLIKIVERLGKRHLPAQLTKLRTAISREASAYRKAKDGVAADAARARALAEGYLEDELDDRGFPKRDAYAARARRQRIADRDRQLADGVPDDDIDVDGEGNWKDDRARDGFHAAEDDLDYAEGLDADALEEDLD